MERHRCKVCAVFIPTERAELGYTDTCVHHSDEQPYVGFQVFTHKNTSSVVKVKANNSEALRLAKRAHSRSR